MIKASKLVDILTLITIFLFLQYVFWFQYAVGEINMFLTIIGILMMLCMLLRSKLNISSLKPGAFVILFMVSTFASCVLFPLNRAISIEYFSRLIRYLIPFFAICIYVGSSYEKLKKIYVSFCVSGVLLSLSLFLFGEYNIVLGGFTVGDLNPNVFSSYILAGLLGSVSLLNCIENKPLRVMLFTTIVLDAIAQVQAGSRRGILVFILVLLMYLFAVSTVRYQKNWIAKLLVAFGGIVVLLIVIFDFSVLVPRYSNISQLFSRTSGDYNRSLYQKAAWDLFLQQPIIGFGLGSVGQVAGMYSHSLYFETLASNGLIGMIILLVPLIRLIWHSRKAERQAGVPIELKMQNATLIIVVLSLLITGIAVAFIYDAIFYLFLALIVVIQSTISTNAQEEKI